MSEDKTIRLNLQLTEPTRLDKATQLALRRKGITISRSRLKELFGIGQVLLEGEPRPGSWMVGPGTHSLECLELGEGTRAASSSGVFLDILYEDNDLLVLDKRSGIPSVPHSAAETETAVGAALAHFPALEGVGRKPLEPGLLHRLDTGTSGCLAFAKSNGEFERLLAAWRAGGVGKTYRALTESGGLEIPSTHRLTMGHDPKSAKRMRVPPPGAPACACAANRSRR